MYGNTRGWILAAVVLLVWGVAVAALWRAGSVTAATLDDDTPVLRPLVLGIDLDDLHDTPDGSGGVPELRRAADDLDRQRREFELYLQRPTAENREPIDAILDRAATAARVGVERPLAGLEAETIAYATPRNRRTLRDLVSIGDALVTRALSRDRDGDADGATRDAAAAFAIGRALFEERLVLEAFDEGLQLMAAALPSLADAGRFNAEAAALVERQVVPARRIVTSTDTAVAGTHAGDLRLIVAEAREPMWRREAALGIGRQKFNTQRLADQRAAEADLAELAATTDDPLLRLAAEAARDLTVEEYRQIR